jgi:hypothetical protein
VGECLPLKEWLEERRDNCRRIAKTKHGTEREGWLEDMQYFSRAVQVVESLIAACGDDHANVPLRMHIALKIMRAWNSGTAGFDGGVVMTINHWIDGGMKGPVPWPDSPFFAAWATGAGFAKVGDYVGFSFQAEMTEAIPVNNPDTTFITPEGTELRREAAPVAMTEERLRKIEARCERSPGGPRTVAKPLEDMSLSEYRLFELKQWASHAREDIPELCAEIRRLQAEAVSR